MGMMARVCIAAGMVCMVPLVAGAPRWQWQIGDFTWLKRLPAEAGAPVNEHPARVEAEALRAKLASVTFTAEKGPEALFAKDELVPILSALREALSLAGPGDDLLLLSTHRRGGSFLNTPNGVTARFFVQGGALNLIVHDARLEFVDRYRGMQILPEFQYGARAVASAVELQSPFANSRRKDWLVFPTAVPASTPAPVSVLGPGSAIAPGPAAGAASVRPAVIRDAASFEQQEQRLRALKRLRDENLITEDEYQQKRREVLKEL